MSKLKRPAKLLIDFDNMWAHGEYIHLPVGSIVNVSWVTQMEHGSQALCTSPDYPGIFFSIGTEHLAEILESEDDN